MLLNGASYSNNFSTVFRAARGADISVEVEDEDLGGKDPLPKYLTEAQIRLPKNQKLSKITHRRKVPRKEPLHTKKPAANSRMLGLHGAAVGTRNLSGFSTPR